MFERQKKDVRCANGYIRYQVISDPLTTTRDIFRAVLHVTTTPISTWRVLQQLTDAAVLSSRPLIRASNNSLHHKCVNHVAADLLMIAHGTS